MSEEEAVEVIASEKNDVDCVLTMPNYDSQFAKFKSFAESSENGEMEIATLQAHLAVLVESIIKDVRQSMDIRLDSKLLVTVVQEQNLACLFESAVNEYNLKQQLLQIYVRYWAKIQSIEKTEIKDNDLFQQQMAYLGLEVTINKVENEQQNRYQRLAAMNDAFSSYNKKNDVSSPGLIGSGWILSSFILAAGIGIGAFYVYHNRKSR